VSPQTNALRFATSVSVIPNVSVILSEAKDLMAIASGMPVEMP
jgi:hypothetical protein